MTDIDVLSFKLELADLLDKHNVVLHISTNRLVIESGSIFYMIYASLVTSGTLRRGE
jgi:hypothetical protein